MSVICDIYVSFYSNSFTLIIYFILFFNSTLFSSFSLSTNFLSSLEATQWINFISQLLSTSTEIASIPHLEERPVVVHCSDGWDRTAQVVALAEILLDPFYRTFDGFKVLIEREWLSFGHKFSDRCGLGADGEQSPIFIQWLDCVYQLTKQFPTSFEFSTSYLVRFRQLISVFISYKADR